MGFAAGRPRTVRDYSALVDEALAVARAAAAVNREPFELVPEPPHIGSFTTRVRVDPYTEPIESFVDRLTDWESTMRSTPEVHLSTAELAFQNERRTFTNTDGADQEQNITESGLELSATATTNGQVEQRSYADFSQAGLEFIDSLDGRGIAERLASEAAALCRAPVCQVDTRDVIVASDQLALQVHETCGHPFELDRILGSEASFAGTSFLKPEDAGSFIYGSPVVNLTADATIPGGLGTFGWDDEGVAAQRTPLVESGVAQNYLTSRETAARVGQIRSNGTMRADGWNNIPMIRMVNVNLEPGDWTVDEIIRDTRKGLIVTGSSSWSLDDRRLNFHFGEQLGYLVEGGEVSQMVRKPAYTGVTPLFWKACDAVAGRRQGEWHLWGMPTCAKGEPMQMAHVAHGAAPARFRNVRVGVEA
jgi:TldD protein